VTALTGVGTRIARMESRGGPEWLSRPRGNTRRTAVNCLEEERDVNLDEALAVRRYFGGDLHLTEHQQLCLKEADRIIHMCATQALDRFVIALQRQGSGAQQREMASDDQSM